MVSVSSHFSLEHAQTHLNGLASYYFPGFPNERGVEL
jgi:hypothetical protein